MNALRKLHPRSFADRASRAANKQAETPHPSLSLIQQ